MLIEKKKTNFPDLKRLPNTNFLKHFLKWIWNKPRIVFEEIYVKYFKKNEIELNQLKIQLIIKKIEIQTLKVTNEKLKSQIELEKINFTLKSLERLRK